MRISADICEHISHNRDDGTIDVLRLGIPGFAVPSIPAQLKFHILVRILLDGDESRPPALIVSILDPTGSRVLQPTVVPLDQPTKQPAARTVLIADIDMKLQVKTVGKFTAEIEVVNSDPILLYFTLMEKAE